MSLALPRHVRRIPRLAVPALRWRPPRRLLLAMLAAAAVAAGAPFAAHAEFSLPAMSLPERPGAAPDPWSFAGPALAELDETAVQVCAADAALRTATGPAEQGTWSTRRTDLAVRYSAMAADYESRVRDRLLAGAVRPNTVPPAAPPLHADTAVNCLEIAHLPPPPPKPAPLPVLAPAASLGVQRLSVDELDAFARAAGWPDQEGWWPQMRAIAYCESGWNIYAHNTSDPNGGSYGLAQLNGRQHFDKAGEDFDLRFDPVVNLRTALWLRTVRGHFGGGGGWSCADKLGIP